MRVPVCIFSTLFLSLLLLPACLFSTVVINEIMKDPAAVSDNDGEWFELHNPDGEAVELGGWIIQDLGRDVHMIPADSGLTIPPGGYAVLGRNGDPAVNGGYSPDYVYDGFTLSNGEDEIILLDASGSMIDSVAYDGGDWPSNTGSTMEFIEGRADNAVGENWLSSTVPFGDGDMGTPGGENSVTGVGIGEGTAGDDAESGTDRSPFQTYPNPFRGTTTIVLNGTESSTGRLEPAAHVGSIVTIRIYDLHGRRVRNLWEGYPETGSRIVWNGKDDHGIDLPPGHYIIRLTDGTGVYQRKVVFAGR